MIQEIYSPKAQNIQKLPFEINAICNPHPLTGCDSCLRGQKPIVINIFPCFLVPYIVMPSVC